MDANIHFSCHVVFFLFSGLRDARFLAVPLPQHPPCGLRSVAECWPRRLWPLDILESSRIVLPVASVPLQTLLVIYGISLRMKLYHALRSFYLFLGCLSFAKYPDRSSAWDVRNLGVCLTSFSYPSVRTTSIVAKFHIY